MQDEDRNTPSTEASKTPPAAHWVAPKLHHFRAGEAEAGVTTGPDGPETGVS
jgi:hypothetical protein